VAEDVSGSDLEWFFEQWVYGGGAPEYAVGWREHEVGGHRLLEVAVEQTREPVFVMPLEIAWSALGERRSARFWNRTGLQHLLVPVDGPVDHVTLDPDAWVLSRSVSEVAFEEGPPRIVAVDPAPGSAVSADRPLSIDVTFHEDVVLSGSEVELRSEDGSPVAVDVSYDSDTRTATVATTDPLEPGVYLLTISDAVTDGAAGIALDGELPGMIDLLPSGDGVPGGAAVIELRVVEPGRPISGRRTSR
jgi:hypothetical protein